MCDLWKYGKDSFVEWWSAKYYKFDGELMAVDKDLPLGEGIITVK